MKDRGRRGQVIKPKQNKYMKVKAGDYVIVKGDELTRKKEKMAQVIEIYKCIDSKTDTNTGETFYKVQSFEGWELVLESSIKDVFVPIKNI